jgi:hypothetical protein
MNNRQRRILQAIFQDPIQSTIKWSAIENLLTALGAEVKEGRGSRIRVTLNGVRQVFYRPHPHNTAGVERIKIVRSFLLRAEVSDV